MARFLGVGCVFKSPRTTHTYVVSPAPQWQDPAQPLKPPAHIIGVGGFGVTYRVVDDRGETFAMKEYFPRDHALRGTDGRITPKRSEDGFSKKIYEEGLRRFVAEGHLLTSFSHPNVLRVVDAFDDNGTSYQLMRLVEGREQLGESDTGAARVERRVTLEDFLRELETGGVPIDLPLIRPVIKQLLDAVEYIHTEGSRKAAEITGSTTRVLLHRDIKPSNILIEAPDGLRDAPAEEILRHADTKAILIDFGSARIFRDVQEDDVSRSIGVVTEGYAPPELKDNDIDSQGPHSDIYSVAAVIWRALMGRKPTTAQLANGAKIAELAQPIVGADGKPRPRASKAFLEAVDRALNAAVGQRPRSVAEWRAQLGGQAGPARKDAKRAAVRTGDGGEKKKGGQAIWWWAMTIGFIAVSAYGFWQHQGGPTRAIEREADAAAEDADRAGKIADDMAARADQTAVIARPLIEKARAKAKEGLERFKAYQVNGPRTDVFHDNGAGDELLGDKLRDVKTKDGVSHHWWCHKKSSDITPARPYETYDDPEFTIDDEAGWACGVNHTHHVLQPPPEPWGAWHLAGDRYTYDGEVDAQHRPSGLGVLTFNNTGILDPTYTGEFTPDGSTLKVKGAGMFETGQFTISLGPPPKEDESMAVATVPGTIDGHIQSTAAGGSVLVIKNNNKTVRGLGWKDHFIGVNRSDDGSQVLESGGKVGAWGRIEQAGAVYRGQLKDEKPDGCGVWTWRDGSKEAGFFEAGKKRAGDLPEDCKRPHYQRPADIDAVARDGAKALPQ
jgi:serine/threonine protein kinase